jgi:octopine/nopaline transport system substrate-binding protein
MSVVGAEAKEWKTVIIGMEGAYEPWNLTNPNGTLGGFEPELAANLCPRMHVTCKLIAQDWDGMIAGLGAGKFDVIMDALSITPERQQQIAFSIPYAATPAGFAAVKDSDVAKLPGTGTTIRLDDTDSPATKQAVAALRTALKGKIIGIQTATVYTKFIEDNFKDVATLREYKTAPEHDLDLEAGRIDVAFDDDTYFTSAFAKPDNKDMTLTGPEIAGNIWGAGEALGLRKTDPELKTMFDGAIKAALADGTIKKLSLKWFKIDVSP